MKKLIFATALFCSVLTSYACEICGCSGSGSQYFGILPGYKNNFIGIRHQYKSFTSHHLPLFEGDIAPVTKEYFTTTEIFSRFNVGKKFQVFTFIPFQNYKQTGDGEDKHISGIGDINLMLAYKLINKDEGRAELKQQLQVAAGVKLPTGAFNKTYKSDDPLNINLQPGSGSVDIPVSVLYTVRKNRNGISAEANYRYNTSNKEHYTFGDRFSTSMKVFRWIGVGAENSILPNVGLSYEHAAKDFDGTEYNEYSGGQMISATAGLETYISKFSLGVVWQKPLNQTVASGRIDVHSRISAQISYKF